MDGPTEICIMALNRIGISTTIASLTEASQEARACSIWYAACRDRILQAYPWKFCERRVTLADLGNPPLNWAHCYAYPNDCLRARYITVPGLRTPRNAQRIPFSLGNNGSVKVIYTDADSAELVYTQQLTDTTLMSPIFKSALAALIAAEISLPLSVSASNAQQALQAYAREVANAAAVEMSEGMEGPEPDSEFISARNLFVDGPQSTYPYVSYPGGY